MQAINNVNFYFNANRVGTLPQSTLNEVPWIKSSLAQEATAGPGGRDLSGGWLSGGAAYSTKATVPTAFAVTRNPPPAPTAGSTVSPAPGTRRLSPAAIHQPPPATQTLF